MRCPILIFFMLLLTRLTVAQGLTETALPLPDSIRISQPVSEGKFTGSNILYSEIAAGIFAEPLKLAVPSFDINQYLNNNWRIDYESFSMFGHSPRISLNQPFIMHPFIHQAAIFNQATYRLSDKLSLGGNSFGINSALSAPLPNPSANQWDTRGASMFMQYKVNKNFRIETRISVTNQQFHP